MAAGLSWSVRLVWLLVATAACQFDHGRLLLDAALEVDAPDAPPDLAIDQAAAPYCDPENPALVACYPFEGSTEDRSGHNLDATMTNVSFVPGKVGMAMQFGTTSAADVADSALFDVSAITIEAWVNPSQIPAAGLRMGILDNQGQYGLFIYEQGQLGCTAGGSGRVTANITANTWTHVACTYDGSTFTIYVNGNALYTQTGGTALATAGTTGISLAADNPPGAGSQLVGLLDEVRILSVARSAPEICADAGCP